MFSNCRLYSWMRLMCTSTSASGSIAMSSRSRRSARPAPACWRAARRSAARAAPHRPPAAPGAPAPSDRPAPPARSHRTAAPVSRGLAVCSQRRKVMPLVLLTMRSGIELVQRPEHGAAHQLGVQRGHAVHLVRAEEGQRAHAHAPLAVLVDQRHLGQRRRIRPAAASASRCSLLIS